MRVAVAVCVIVGLPPVPVTVKGYVPLATDLDAVTVSVVDEPVVGLGAKAPVAPAGKPLTDIVTGELKPPVRVIATV